MWLVFSYSNTVFYRAVVFIYFFILGYSCFTMLCQFLLYRKVEFPVLYSRFSLVIYFIHVSVYMLIPNSQFIPPPFPHLVSIRLLSTSVSLFLPCKLVHLYHLVVFTVIKSKLLIFSFMNQAFSVVSKNLLTGNFLAVQWLGLHTSTAGGTGSILGQGTKIL